MQCRSHAAQLGKLSTEFKTKNIQVLLVLGDTPVRAKQYVESLHLPFSVLADPERQIYHQFGLGKVVGIIQRTASIIIDCNGKIVYIKETANPMIWLKESAEIRNFILTDPTLC
jgi:thioredoxin-dependent peroxiredoxin